MRPRVIRGLGFDHESITLSSPIFNASPIRYARFAPRWGGTHTRIQPGLASFFFSQETALSRLLVDLIFLNRASVRRASLVYAPTRFIGHYINIYSRLSVGGFVRSLSRGNWRLVNPTNYGIEDSSRQSKQPYLLTLMGKRPLNPGPSQDLHRQFTYFSLRLRADRCETLV